MENIITLDKANWKKIIKGDYGKMNSYGKMDRKNFDTMNKRYEMLIKFLPKRIAYKITIAII